MSPCQDICPDSSMDCCAVETQTGLSWSYDQIKDNNNREIYNCVMLPFTLSAHKVWTCYFVFRRMCKIFARCHFKPLWTVMSKLYLSKTKVTFFLYFFLFRRLSSVQSHLAERCMTTWRFGLGIQVLIFLNLSFELWSEEDIKRMGYLSSGHVRAWQTQKRWSCACLVLQYAGFLCRNDLMEQKR